MMGTDGISFEAVWRLYPIEISAGNNKVELGGFVADV
jgi:hypothetical protein